MDETSRLSCFLTHRVHQAAFQQPINGRRFAQRDNGSGQARLACSVAPAT